MTDLTITQNSTAETISLAVFNKLYESVRTINTGHAHINGNITAQSAYRDEVGYLTTRFNGGDEGKLDITVAQWYIKFADPVVQSILLASIGDGTGVTESTAASALFADAFKNNTQIQTFDEFNLFTTQNRTASYDFSGCTSLRSINLSQAFAMKKGAFDECTSLQSVDALGAVNAIPENAFRNCSSLSSFVFPSTLKEIHHCSFEGDSNLVINISDLSHIQTFLGTAWGQGHWSAWWAHDRHGVGPTIVGDNYYSTECTHVGDYAFFGVGTTPTNFKFKTINLPNLEYVGKCAFASMPELEEVISLGRVTQVTNTGGGGGWRFGLFGNCKKLKKVRLPETLTSLEDEFFAGDQSLEEVNIPTACTSIGTNAFVGHDGLPNLTSLHTIVCRPTTPPTLNSTLPSNANLKIYVPDASISTYQSASGWSNYSSKIVGLSTYTGDL